MILDDDVCLTDRSIGPALEALDDSESVGAVSMPHFTLAGHLISSGGRRLLTKNGVLYIKRPTLTSGAAWIEVESLDGSAFLYRTIMRDTFSWDDRLGEFEDYDKSLQILYGGKWKQVIVPKGRVIHDHSWLGSNLNYQRKRHDGIAVRRSYKLFCAKWGVRLDLRSHILLELIFPTLTLTRQDRLVGFITTFIEKRAAMKNEQMYRMNSSSNSKCD